MFNPLIRSMFVAFAILVLPAPSYSDANRLTVVADEWPPFSGEALPNRGISLDVITTVLTRAGYQPDVQVLPWARIMAGARAGQFDVYGSLFFDQSMTEFVTYSEAYYNTEVRLVQRVGDDHAYTTVDALSPYTIAVGDGFLYQEEFDAAAYLSKVVVPTTLQALQMVAHGRVDLTLDSVDVVNFTLRQLDPSVAETVEFAPGVLETQSVHMAVRNSLTNREQVIADFNRVLNEMRSDGSLDQLLAKHR